MLNHITYIKDKSLDWILLIHGFGGSTNSWKNQISFFNEKYNLLIVDLPGHGKSLVDSNVDLTFENISDYINEILLFNKVNKVNLIGISLGATIALSFAKINPEKVTSLILSGAIVFINKRLSFLILIASTLSKIFGPRRVYKLSVFLVLPKKSQVEFRKEFIKESMNLTKEDYKSWVKLILNLKNNLNNLLYTPLNTKCLITMGKSDYFFLPSIRYFMENHKYVKLKLFNNSGHVLNLENNELFVKTCLNFIECNSGIIEADNNIYKNDKIELLYNYKFSAVKEAGDGLFKILTLYLTALSAIIVYIFSENPDTENIYFKLIFKILFMVSIFVMLITPLIVYGIFKGVKSIERLLKFSDYSLFQVAKMDEFTRRGVRTIYFIGLMMVVLILCIIFVLWPFINIL
ncbi:MAG: alpha/beta fold hydrolase [Saprospiraceae bacterium]|nr:alpha/beta fold hydrolase [Saprospiraceae bacterium]